MTDRIKEAREQIEKSLVRANKEGMGPDDFWSCLFTIKQLQTIENLLQPPQVDVESLKRETDDVFHDAVTKTGSGLASKDAVIDHILSRGLIAQGWRPIAEAPKNQKILLCWAASAYSHGHVITGIVDPANYDPGIWGFFDDDDGGDEARKLRGVSHWMPLPSPPDGDAK